MIIKICGIKTLEDALIAIEAGADMLGFNFYPLSPRHISPDDCAELVAGLRSQVASLRTHNSRLTSVGIFVNESPKRIREIMEICDLDLAQLSGDESPEDLAALGGKAFKTIRLRSLAEADDLLEKFGCNKAPALLVDSHVNRAYGGTGEIGDWALARHLAEQASILLAGGLTPENVAAAIRAVNPWGVDVASGVESSPGVKDHAKISAFISAARAGIT